MSKDVLLAAVLGAHGLKGEVRVKTFTETPDALGRYRHLHARDGRVFTLTKVKRVKAGDFRESELWCLSRLGARKLFYGLSNLVVPPAVATRWVEALINVSGAGEALATMARLTDDTTRDLSAATRETVARKLRSLPNPERLLATLEGEEEDDRTLGRIFGEELPSGLVLAEAVSEGNG